MRVPRLVRINDVAINMTPMIDVVFLLIIFFLVNSHLARQEAQLPLPLPTAASGEPPDAAARRVTLNVMRDGALTLAGRRATVDDLAARLGELAARDQQPLELRIRCDRGLPYRLIAPVLRACARGGAWQVSFSVVRPAEAN